MYVYHIGHIKTYWYIGHIKNFLGAALLTKTSSHVAAAGMGGSAASLKPHLLKKETGPRWGGRSRT